MEIAHTFRGTPYLIENGSVWDATGTFVGTMADGKVYDAEGHYRGELHNDRLGFDPMHSGLVAPARAGQDNRVETAPALVAPMMLPSGWRDFRG